MNDLIIKRINELLKEKNTNICDVSLKGGLTPSTIYDIMYRKTKVPKVITIKKFCDGLGITMREFFDTDYFMD